MALGTIVTLSAATVAAALVTGTRVFGFKRMVRNATVTDVVFTGGVTALFAGTLGGTLVAVLSGLLMALVLSAFRWGHGLLYRLKSLVGRKAGQAVDDEHDLDGVWVYDKICSVQ